MLEKEIINARKFYEQALRNRSVLGINDTDSCSRGYIKEYNWLIFIQDLIHNIVLYSLLK